ncbi:hypothetical protein FS837_003488 [Tulasnella sp. UAMH 9824]|nr:hypothetical protein FS837_003488 [Tulasnella sp. UAMH 9824]
MSKPLGEEQQQAIEFLRVLETGHDEQAIVGILKQNNWDIEKAAGELFSYPPLMRSDPPPTPGPKSVTVFLRPSPTYPNASITVWNRSAEIFETVSSSAAREVDVHSGVLNALPTMVKSHSNRFLLDRGVVDLTGEADEDGRLRKVIEMSPQENSHQQSTSTAMVPEELNSMVMTAGNPGFPIGRGAGPSNPQLLNLQRQLNAIAMAARISGFPIGRGASPSSIRGSGVGSPMGERVESSGQQRLLDHDRLQQPVVRTAPASTNLFARVPPSALLQRAQMNAIMAMGDRIPGFPIGGGAGQAPDVRGSGVGVSMGAFAEGSSATGMLGNVMGGFGLVHNLEANMGVPTPDSTLAQGSPAQPSSFSSRSPLLIRSLSASPLILREHHQAGSKRRGSQVLNADLETPSQHYKRARTNALIFSTDPVNAQNSAGDPGEISSSRDLAHSEAEERSWEGIPATRHEPVESASMKNNPEGIFVPWIKFRTVAEEKECYYRQRSTTATAYGGFSDIFQCDAQLPDGTQALRFNREVKIWAALQHPNIAPLLGFNLSGEVSIISPWYINGNIAAYLENNPNLDKLNLIRQVAAGVSYLHGRNPVIVHGDIKPDNILVDIDGTPKLIDFGLSKVVEDAQGVATLTSASLRDAGNARWIAPELLLEEGISRSCNTDTFSFGCVAFFIFTGDIPFKDISDRTLTLARHHGAQPISNDAHYLDLKADLVLMSLLSSCWNADPTQRPRMSLVVLGLAPPSSQPRQFVGLDDGFHASFASGNRRQVL